MDIMDSSDTPEGGMNQHSSSSSSSSSVRSPVNNRGELPLSVDEDDGFTQPSPARHGLFSSASHAHTGLADNDSMSSMPTSQDDVFMSTQEHVNSSSLSDRLSADMSQMKDKTEAGLESMKKELKQGVQKVEEKYEAMKAQHNNSSSSSTSSSSSVSSPSFSSSFNTAEAMGLEDPRDDPFFRSANRHGAPSQSADSLVHPLASNMRDAHLHPGLVSLPTHANEHNSVSPVSSSSSVSAAQQRGLDAVRNMEPKDESAVGSSSSSNRGAAATVSNALGSMHAKLEEGIESIKGKVDEWRKHGSSGAGAANSASGQGTSTGTNTDQHIPTLINKDDQVMSEEVRLRQNRGLGSQ